ncbi:unnamed protein product [Euphydryas editha]|uniref:Regulatory protein zeste n=1 Tax=Euphydryas editha TaxID=104508 RepID=A0AAU9THE3_EUPED|nr:unnamed protein product [Euphydryas editha]
MESSMKNFIPEEKTNRLRGENWTQEEKDLFLEIMRKSAPIVENKLTDTNTNRRKKLEWLNIQSKLKELTGKPKDIAQIKGFWRRSKVAAKKSVSLHRRALQATGGGQQPPSPSPEDLKILECCPTDFVIDKNDFDSDSVLHAAVPEEPSVTSGDNTIELHNSTLYDIEEDPDIMEVDKTVVVIADVHSAEIDKASNMASDMPNDIKVSCDSKAKKTGKTEIDKASIKKNITGKAALLESNIEIKRRATAMMEKEHTLKMKYHQNELAHQQLRHKLEIDLYLLDKEKKQLELELLKKKLNKE